MFKDWLSGLRKYVLYSTLSVLASAGITRAQDREAELRSQVEQQAKQLQELQRRLDAMQTAPVSAGSTAGGGAVQLGSPQVDANTVKDIVRDYLKENPGAGLPSGVQTGYTNQGFVIRSGSVNPSYANWNDQSKIPSSCVSAAGCSSPT